MNEDDYDGRMIDNNTQWYPDVTAKGGSVVGRYVYIGRENVPESREADRKIYRKVVAVRMKVVGSVDEDTIQVKPANERELRARFPQAWEAFNGAEPVVEGTPLKDLGFLTGDQIIFCKMNGISVVEQLAEVSDGRCQTLGFGWRTNRNKAQSFLKDLSDTLVREDRLARLKSTKKSKAA